ncbi:hypothetical protein T459_23028 [Capsicum annuum]|uniref:Uncharacterized protein n=1 Tax=Capsicum annuum TaxID=4072 RepID=A0A2G2YR73_CAPAN|nr:hypothetical protein T459_23028 [Capsicum annuum]
MKCFLVICLVSSISLISLTAFSNRSLWLSPCSDCSAINIHTTYAYSTAVTNNVRRKNVIKEKEEVTGITHILFGIGGSAKTWNDRKGYSDLWWEPNVTRGFVWLDEKPGENETWPESSPPYRVSEDTSKFKYTCWFGDRSAVRIARIVKESFELGLENVRWFVMGDDDTVFFTKNLVTVLGKYDHNQMYYIGGNSESVEQDLVHSYGMAYGGGGIAISYPLAEVLVKILDSCINRYSDFYGSDQKIGGCMAEIGVPLTKELGFHQMDIHGSPRGFLAAHPLAPIVSLHHIAVIHSLIPLMDRVDSVKKVMEAYKKDSSRTMQQSFCYDLKKNWTLSVSWGYSIQLYPSLMNAKELETPLRTFETWKGFEEPFTFNTRPNYMEPCEKPIDYYLDRVFELNNGETLTTYKRIADYNKQCENENYKPALAVQVINITAPILSPQVWRQFEEMVIFRHYTSPFTGSKYLIVETKNKAQQTRLLTHTLLTGWYASSWPPLKNPFSMTNWTSVQTPNSDQSFKLFSLQAPDHHYANITNPLPSLGRRIALGEICWGAAMTLEGEYRHSPRYWEWTQDILGRSQETLRKVHIYDAAYASLFTYDHNSDIFQEFCESWCPMTNTLLTSVRELSISLWDLHVLGGLPIQGILYKEVVPVAKELTGLDEKKVRYISRIYEYLFAAFHNLRDASQEVSFRDWITFWCKKHSKYGPAPPRTHYSFASGTSIPTMIVYSGESDAKYFDKNDARKYLMEPPSTVKMGEGQTSVSCNKVKATLDSDICKLSKCDVDSASSLEDEVQVIINEIDCKDMDIYPLRKLLHDFFDLATSYDQARSMLHNMNEEAERKELFYVTRKRLTYAMLEEDKKVKATSSIRQSLQNMKKKIKKLCRKT